MEQWLTDQLLHVVQIQLPHQFWSKNRADAFLLQRDQQFAGLRVIDKGQAEIGLLLRVVIAGTGNQLQVQVRQGLLQLLQAGDQPAGQNAAGTGQYQGFFLLLLPELPAAVSYCLKGRLATMVQLLPGMCEFYTATLFLQQGRAQLTLQQFDLAADRPMGYMQLLRGRIDTAFVRHCDKSPESIQGR